MIKPLLFDLATNVGWCVGCPGDDPKYGSHRLTAKNADDVGTFAVDFDTFAGGLIMKHRPTHIGFCATILPTTRRIFKNGKPVIIAAKFSPATVRKLNGLAWHAEFLAAKYELACFEMYESQAKKFFVGKGNADKAETIERCQSYGLDPANQDEADAIQAWAFACDQLAPKVPSRFQLGALAARPE